MHDQYGDVVRLGPNFLLYRTPGAWKEIYGHRKQGERTFIKDPEANIEAPGGPNIFNEGDENHSRIRRLMSHGFSEKALKDQEPLVQHYVDLLLERLHNEVAACPDPIEMTRWYNFTTFDIISDLSFGEAFGCLRDKRYHPWVLDIFAIGVKTTVILGKTLLMYPYISWLVGMMLPQDLHRKRANMYQLTKERVDRRLENDAARPDFIAYITRHNDERGMTQKELYANAFTLITAGSETSATLLSGFTFFLLKNPAAYKELVNEIRGTFQRQNDITFQSTAGLQYLNAALEESLRMYPPVPGVTIPRLAVNGDALIEGQ